MPAISIAEKIIARAIHRGLPKSKSCLPRKAIPWFCLRKAIKFSYGAVRIKAAKPGENHSGTIAVQSDEQAWKIVQRCGFSRLSVEPRSDQKNRPNNCKPFKDRSGDTPGGSTLSVGSPACSDMTLWMDSGSFIRSP